VVLNAAWALYVADRVRDAKEGVGLAWQSLQSGAALRKIEELKHFSQGQ
jgi:anthranilate phosphoribosyltransferase